MDNLEQHRLRTLSEISAILMVPEKAVRKWVRQGMPYIPFGKKKIRFCLAYVNHWLDSLK